MQIVKNESVAAELKEIRHLLSHLHGEITALEGSYSEILKVLRDYEGAANKDDLTGLWRRRAFFRKWDQLLQECQKLGESCGVLMIDVDRFKSINDQHGHATGDEVLRRVADLLKKYETSSCHVARLGGEEFAVAARGTEAELLGLAEMIRRGAERLHGPVVTDKTETPSNISWRCTLSVGMASSNLVGYNPSKLLKAADEALYHAKESGRNQVKAA